MDRFKKYVELVANLSTVILCAVVIVVFYQKFTTTDGPRRPQVPQYQIGEIVPLQGANFAMARRTLVLYFQSSCRYCTDSMPFYRALRERQAGRRQEVQFLGVAPEPLSIAVNYLRTHQVELDRVFTVQRGELKLRGTPTLLLLNERGQLVKQWRGRLSDALQTEVRDAMFGVKDGSKGE
jgi:hypothetical protein